MPTGRPLDELDPMHPAIRSLLKRGLDPDNLARNYGVLYCEKCLDSRPALREPRIIIPIHELVAAPEPGPTRGRLAGWQARTAAAQPAEGTPKYLTAAGMRKSDLLYGLPLAVGTTGPVVIVEGITDVWKIGNNAVAVLGKTISHAQCDLLVRHFGGRPIVVWLDEDADVDAARMRDAIQAARASAGDWAPILVARTPAGRDDPGGCTSEQIGAVLRQALGTAAPA
jgi:DNA primase